MGPDLGGWGRQAAFENVGNGTVALLCTVALFMAPATSGSVRPAEGGAAGSQVSDVEAAPRAEVAWTDKARVV